MNYLNIVGMLQSIYDTAQNPNRIFLHVQTSSGSRAVNAVRIYKSADTGDLVVVLESYPEEEIGTTTSSN